MALSPAKKFLANRLAQIAIAKANTAPNGTAPNRTETGEGATEYELLLAALGEDLARLSGISSNEAKALFKIDAMEKFAPHIDGAVKAMNETGKAVQDEIFARMMIWNFDIGEYAKCLEMASLMLQYGMNMPQTFNLPLPAWLASNIGEIAEVRRSTGEAFDLEILQKTESLLDGKDVPDKHRAKLEKALGFAFLKIADDLESGEKSPEIAGELTAARTNALDYFQSATKHNPQIGVKKEMEKLNRALAKAA